MMRLIRKDVSIKIPPRMFTSVHITCEVERKRETTNLIKDNPENGAHNETKTNAAFDVPNNGSLPLSIKGTGQGIA